MKDWKALRSDLLVSRTTGEWYSWVGSNHRPPVPQTGALNQLSYSCTAVVTFSERHETRSGLPLWQAFSLAPSCLLVAPGCICVQMQSPGVQARAF